MSEDALALQLRRRLIDRELDHLYEEVSELGRRFGQRLRETKENVGRSQLRGIQSVSATATRVSAVKNHVKNQTGKDTPLPKDGAPSSGKLWGFRNDGRRLGDELLELLDRLATEHVERILEKLQQPAETDVETTSVSQPARSGEQESDGEAALDIELSLQQGLIETFVCAALHAELGEGKQ